MEGVTVGRIAHYVALPDEQRDGAHRAAIITEVFGDGNIVNLTVFMDWINDGEKYRSQPLLWATSRRYSEMSEPGTWHWPEQA